MQVELLSLKRQQQKRLSPGLEMEEMIKKLLMEYTRKHKIQLVRNLKINRFKISSQFIDNNIKCP